MGTMMTEGSQKWSFDTSCLKKAIGDLDHNPFFQLLPWVLLCSLEWLLSNDFRRFQIIVACIQDYCCVSLLSSGAIIIASFDKILFTARLSSFKTFGVGHSALLIMLLIFAHVICAFTVSFMWPRTRSTAAMMSTFSITFGDGEKFRSFSKTAYSEGDSS